MLGAIIGDIVGSRWEFNSTNDYDFELFSDKNKFTDDTICTVAIADALLKGRDYGESLHDWCRRYMQPKGGYGARFRAWVESNNPKPYGSFGNGSAMRVSPIGMWFTKTDDLLKQAELSAACTHNHPQGINGAKAVAWAIHFAIESGNCTCIDFGFASCVDLKDYKNRFDETCQGTIPPAFEIIYQSKSFEDAIRRAVSLGADADTLGAIVGSIAEHLWGIPEWMKHKAMSYLTDEMREVVIEFYKKVEKRKNYRITPSNIDTLAKDEVFVFGSNKYGHHMGGAAKAAHKKFGAVWGEGDGHHGQSYAISTMEGLIETAKNVNRFVRYAKNHQELTFLVTPIGCGIAGYTPLQIAPLFAQAIDLPNVYLPKVFWEYFRQVNES